MEVFFIRIAVVHRQVFLLSQEFLNLNPNNFKVVAGVAVQHGRNNLTILPMIVMRETGKMRVMWGVVPAQHALIAF